MNDKETAAYNAIPKKYRDRVEEVEYDGGWWFYLTDGWICNTSAAPHTIHEPSMKECMMHLRGSVPENR